MARTEVVDMREEFRSRGVLTTTQGAPANLFNNIAGFLPESGCIGVCGGGLVYLLWRGFVFLNGVKDQGCGGGVIEVCQNQSALNGGNLCGRGQ